MGALKPVPMMNALGQNKWQTKLHVAAQKAVREILHVGRKMLSVLLGVNVQGQETSVCDQG